MGRRRGERTKDDGRKVMMEDQRMDNRTEGRGHECVDVIRFTGKGRKRTQGLICATRETPAGCNQDDITHNLRET